MGKKKIFGGERKFRRFTSLLLSVLLFFTTLPFSTTTVRADGIFTIIFQTVEVIDEVLGGEIQVSGIKISADLEDANTQNIILQSSVDLSSGQELSTDDTGRAMLELQVSDPLQTNYIYFNASSTSNDYEVKIERIPVPITLGDVLTVPIYLTRKSSDENSVPDGMYVTIQTADEDFYIECEEADSVREIKQRIFEKKQIGTDTQVLTYNDQVLENDSILQEYSIERGSVITLTIEEPAENKQGIKVYAYYMDGDEKKPVSRVELSVAQTGCTTITYTGNDGTVIFPDLAATDDTGTGYPVSVIKAPSGYELVSDDTKYAVITEEQDDYTLVEFEFKKVPQAVEIDEENKTVTFDMSLISSPEIVIRDDSFTGVGEYTNYTFEPDSSGTYTYIFTGESREGAITCIRSSVINSKIVFDNLTLNYDVRNPEAAVVLARERTVLSYDEETGKVVYSDDDNNYETAIELNGTNTINIVDTIGESNTPDAISISGYNTITFEDKKDNEGTLTINCNTASDADIVVDAPSVTFDTVSYNEDSSTLPNLTVHGSATIKGASKFDNLTSTGTTTLNADVTVGSLDVSNSGKIYSDQDINLTVENKVEVENDSSIDMENATLQMGNSENNEFSLTNAGTITVKTLLMGNSTSNKFSLTNAGTINVDTLQFFKISDNNSCTNFYDDVFNTGKINAKKIEEKYNTFDAELGQNVIRIYSNSFIDAQIEAVVNNEDSMLGIYYLISTEEEAKISGKVLTYNEHTYAKSGTAVTITDSTTSHTHGWTLTKLDGSETGNTEIISSEFTMPNCPVTITVHKTPVDIPKISSVEYDGEAHTADVPESEQYTVNKNLGGINAGTYDVVLKLTDTADYEWNTDAIKEDIDSGDVGIGEDGTITLNFTITQVTPTLNVSTPYKDNKVTYGDEAFALDVGSDSASSEEFTKYLTQYLTYESSNENVVTVSDAGVVTIVGCGTSDVTVTLAETTNYTSASETISITVLPKAGNITYDNEDATVTYGAEFSMDDLYNFNEQPESFTFSSNNTKVITFDEDGNALIVGAGTATVTLSAGATAHYTADTAEFEITVNPADIKDCDITVDVPDNGYIYDGTEKTPTVTVKLNGDKLTEIADYEVSYKNNKDTGEATVTITGEGNFTGTATRKFTISNTANEWVTKPVIVGWTYGDEANTPTFEAKFGNDTATVEYRKNDADSDTASDEADADGYTTEVPTEAGNYTVRVTIPATSVYSKLVSDGVDFTIKKAAKAPDALTEGLTPVHTVENVGMIELPRNWQWSEDDRNKELADDEAVTATANYIGEDAGNYVITSVTVTITRQPCQHEGGTATCTELAMCTTCGKPYGGVDEKNHTSIVEKVGAKEATCTETGYTGNTVCTDCETVLTAGTEIPVIAHSYKSEVTKEATAEEEGIKTYTCEVCGDTYTESIEKKTAESPYIKDENNKQGWDSVRAETSEAINELIANPGESKTVTVVMNGADTVPGDIFTQIKGQDVTIVFDMGDGIKWSVDGKTVVNDNIEDINFKVYTGTDANAIPDNIMADVINNVTGERYTMGLTLAYDGEFGFTAVMNIGLDEKNAGYYANLFYYNKTDNKLDFVTADKIAEDGTANLTFTHASDYTIVIDEASLDPALSSSGITTPVDDTKPAENTSGSSNSSTGGTGAGSSNSGTGGTGAGSSNSSTGGTGADSSPESAGAAGTASSGGGAASEAGTETGTVNTAETTTTGTESESGNTTETTKRTRKNTTVELSRLSYIYNGKAKKPKVTVKDFEGNIIDSKYYTVTYKNNKKVGKATVTITFKGVYTGTITKTFKIRPKTTSLKKVASKKKSVTLTWKKQTKQVTGYQIQYSTSKKFTKETTKRVTAKSTKTTTKTIKKLLAKKKYYFRIRTYKTVNGKKYYSVWSKSKTVKTK